MSPSTSAPATRPPLSWWRAFVDFIGERFERRSAVGIWLTLDVLLLAGAVWAFSGLLEEVLDREGLVRWDVAVNAWFHAHASPTGTKLFQIVTLLGSPGEWAVVALAAGWLLWRKEWFLLVVWLASTAGGKVVELALKATIHRTRPAYAAVNLHGHSYSFPSGHTTMSAVVYTMLVFVVGTALGWHAHRRLRFYAAAWVLVLLIGFSRLYLGVHYPSDVLGGLAAGAAWVALCMSAVRLAIGKAEAERRPLSG